MVMFLAANLAVLVSAAAATRCLRLRGIMTNALAACTCAVAQIVLTLLVAGVLMAHLTPVTVLLLNLGAACLSVGCMLRLRGPIAGADLRAAWRCLVEAGCDVARSPLTCLLVLLTALVGVLLAVLGVLLPPYAYDGLAYHLPSVAAWVQAGRIYTHPYSFYSNVYPADGELCFTWLALFLHSDMLVNTGQLGFAGLAVCAVAGLARVVGLRQSGALAAGCLFFLTPVVLVQATTAYVDVAFAAMFLVCVFFTLRYLYERRAAHLVLAGVAAALTMGMKSTGVAYVGVLLLVVVGDYYRRWFEHDGAKHELAPLHDGAKAVFALGGPALLLVAYWYLRTWQAFGNPVYPVTVEAFGHVLFAGKGAVQASILSAQAPAAIVALPWWQQMLVSWFSDLPGHLGFYIYDQRLGGFGLQWPLLELPALLVLAGYTLRKRLDLFAVLIVPFVVILCVEPANWWSRYTLFLVALGAIAVVFVIERLHRWELRGLLQVALLGMVLVSVYYSLWQVNFTPSLALLTKLAQIPARERTIGAVWMPQYAWVDMVPADARIGYIAATDDYWTVYPLFGRRFQHTVVVLKAADAAHFVRSVRDERVAYLCLPKGSTYAVWAAQRPAMFRAVYMSPGGDSIYQVLAP